MPRQQARLQSALQDPQPYKARYVSAHGTDQMQWDPTWRSEHLASVLERCLLEALRDKGSVVEWCFSEMLLYHHLSCQLLDDSLLSPPATPLFPFLAPGAGPDKLDIERVFRENYLALLLALFQGPQLGTLMSLWVVEAWTIARRQPSSDGCCRASAADDRRSSRRRRFITRLHCVGRPIVR